MKTLSKRKKLEILRKMLDEIPSVMGLCSALKRVDAELYATLPRDERLQSLGIHKPRNTRGSAWWWHISDDDSRIRAVHSAIKRLTAKKKKKVK